MDIPVERYVVVDVIVDLHHEAVALAHDDPRPREPPVHRGDALRHAQPRHRCHRHLQKPKAAAAICQLT